MACSAADRPDRLSSKSFPPIPSWPIFGISRVGQSQGGNGLSHHTELLIGSAETYGQWHRDYVHVLHSHMQAVCVGEVGWGSGGQAGQCLPYFLLAHVLRLILSFEQSAPSASLLAGWYASKTGCIPGSEDFPDSHWNYWWNLPPFVVRMVGKKLSSCCIFYSVLRLRFDEQGRMMKNSIALTQTNLTDIITKTKTVLTLQMFNYFF